MKTVLTVPIVQNTTGPISLGTLAGSVGLTAPISVTELLRKLSVKTFDAIVTTPDPEALGGDVHLTIRGNGTYELSVHMHDSGAPDYSFRLGIFLRSASGIIIAFYSRGTVHGTDYIPLHPGATGFRDFHDPQQGVSDVLIDNWDDFSAGTLEVNREWTNNFEEWATSLFLEKFVFVVGAVTIGGPATLLIWAAGEVGDLTGIRLPGELGLAGLIAAEGQYFLAGPTFFVPVFIAGVLVSAALFKRRRPISEERAELSKVFAGTLDCDRIWITNLEGIGGRPFTIFNLDGDETMIAASSSNFPNFDNLLTNNQSPQASLATKRIFVHELTHAWQYQHQRFLTSVCKIIEARVGEVLEGRSGIYNYTPGSDWDTYNMEQQANIVADWYSVTFNSPIPPVTTPLPPTTNPNAGTTNERYIRENILLEHA